MTSFKSLLLALALVLPLFAAAQGAAPGFAYKEATELTITGKVFPDTPNPYQRIDTARFHGLTKEEVRLVQESSGIAVAFRTDSPSIRVWPEYGKAYFGGGTTGFAGRGFDLYIKKDGKWLWAASGLQNDNALDKPVNLIKGMDDSVKECLLYLPVRSRMESVKIGVEEGRLLEPLPQPFRHRVAVFGSSFTHGASTSKSGMAYPSILTRETGIQFLNLGVSGRCRLQDYFAAALAEAPDVDAFLFDTFSNPTPEEIKERLFPFIETIQAAHPGKPLIFQQTIYRERRNFNLEAEKYESERMELVAKLMKEACRKYKDVYFITSTNATSPDHYTSVDGTHPGDYGYTLWARSIRKPVLKILKKYGIK
ncbi:MAG: SGNH/GDSL hydrolase family protein [Bacteroidales bacterium]|nr:SGNH/GDSL hydrolase family protein [Bacteroidales bacterium]